MASSVGASELAKVGRVAIGFAKYGCFNRPLYQICVFPHRKHGRHWEGSIVEQLGTYDPVPNKRNEKLVALNLDRIRFWLAKDADVSTDVLELLGLSGFLPIHPLTYIHAKRMRQKNEQRLEEQSAVIEGAEGSRPGTETLREN